MKMICQLRLFEELDEPQNPRKIELLDLLDYDKVIVSYSGGKDSLACILKLLEWGVPKEKLVLWHQLVDGAPGDSPLMDWPCTHRYVLGTGEALNIPVMLQWRNGGFLGELLRENRLSGDVEYQDGGVVVNLPTTLGTKLTRRKFPAKGSIRQGRWCSEYLKISVFSKCLNHHPRFKEGRFLVVTGERAEESHARSRYSETESHPCSRKNRRVDWFRLAITWPEEKVWEIIKRHKIMPHPAYLIGWNRTSCLMCVFSTPDLWRMVQEVAPESLTRLIELEKDLNFTLDRKRSLPEMASCGQSRIPTDDPDTPKYLRYALDADFTADDLIVEQWKLPAGAFRGAEGGPS